MKHRAAAVVAACSLALTTALAAPVPDGPASVDAAGPVGAALTAYVQSLDDIPAPPRRPDGEPQQLGDVAPPAKQATVGTGALGEVVDAVLDDQSIPAEVEAQVRTDDGRVRIEIAHSDEDAARAAVVEHGGRRIVQVTDTLLAADVPADEVAHLQAETAVDSLSLPALLSPPAGFGTTVPMAVGEAGAEVTNLTRTDAWHDDGYTGAGVSVGIVDYFDGTTWNSAQATGDVPAPAGTFCRKNGTSCNPLTDPDLKDVHGVGVAEAIHDMAPDAAIYIASVLTNEDLRAAIDYFAAQGVKIMSRSLGGFFDGPGDGTGPSADLVDYAVSKGIAWFNAAGNAGASAMDFGGEWEWRGGYWRGKWRDANKNGWLDFAHYELDSTGRKTGKVTYHDTMFIYCSPYFRLRWNDWYDDSPTDYDIYRIVNGKAVNPGYTPNTQDSPGDAPIELQDGAGWYFNCSSGWIEIAIHLYDKGSGVTDDILEIQGTSADIYGTATSTYSAADAFVDSRNAAMAVVGAVDPAAGITIATYSSQGPTQDKRKNLDLSAVSNFTSRAYAGKGGTFNGTSAATPVVSGAAALVLSRFGPMTPAQLVSRLKSDYVVDRGAKGTDHAFGAGELTMTKKTFVSTPAPRITGTRVVGSTLTAVKPTWSPSAKFSYQWYRGTTAIDGATKATYKLTKDDGGKKIRVRVLGERKGHETVEKHSAYTTPITKVFTRKANPKITGTVKVGRTLTASYGTWSPKPTKIAYQWNVNGKAIKGATKKTYTVKSADVGKRLTVTVKVSKSGYKTATKTSAKTKLVVR